MSGPARDAAALRKREKAASFRLVCRGCDAWIQTVSRPEEAELRVIEFVRQHREHFPVEIDENGLSVTPYGIKRGQRSAEE